MSYKYYLTDWIPELGRYTIFTSVIKGEESQNLAAESFIFALDRGKFFRAKRLFYQFNKDHKLESPIDETFMFQAALEQAKAEINLQRAEAYQKSKNIDVYRKEFELQECKLSLILILKIKEKYEVELIKVSNESGDKDLRKDLIKLLALSKLIQVTPFESQ
jgi:hypothetical protein